MFRLWRGDLRSTDRGGLQTLGRGRRVNPFLAAALEYRKAGLHPIALLPRSKRPLVPWREYQKRMPAVEEIQGWWAVCPDANVGILLGRGAFAVDLDGPDAEAALRAAGIDLGHGPSSLTSRGRHVFFRGAAPDKIGLLPHVDVRGVGYVVAPPSVHESGHVYAWETAITGVLPSPPPALVALLAEQRPRAAATQEKWLSLALEGVSEGTRDITCYKLAAYFTGKGVPQDVIEALLFLWADRCEPPFPHEEVVRKVRSASKHEVEVEGPPVGLAEALGKFLTDLSAPPEARPVLAATELPSLDKLLDGGFGPGDLVYLGARPSVGKSALALQISRHVASRQGVLYVSREMPVQALVRRLVAQAAHLSLSKLKTGELLELEREMIRFAASNLMPLKLWFTADILTTTQLATALDAYAPGQLGLVVCDYLQLFKPAEPIRDPRARVEAVSEELKRLAVAHEVPFLVLSSLRRPERSARDWRPGLSDLRESGELEHDADIVLFLHRELASQDTELILAKQRDGEVGQFPLRFHGPTVTFEETR